MMSIASIRRVLLVAALCAAGTGCGGDAPAGGGPQAASAGTAGSAKGQELSIKDMGSGLKPARGTVQIVPAGSLAVEFEPAQMDFGVLPPGGTARGTSRIWNVGTAPLRIMKSITSCGCTAAEDLSGRVIPAGGYTEFTTTMTMKSGTGEKMEKITVFFGGAGGHRNRFAVQYYTAEVSLPVRLIPSHLAASSRDRQTNRWVHTMSGNIEVRSLDGKPFRILRAHGAPPQYVGFDPASDDPRSEYTLRWDLSRFGDDIPWFWVVETDRPDAPVIDARIRHASTLPAKVDERPWEPSDQRVLVGLVSPDEPFEITAEIEFDAGHVPDPTTATVSSRSPFLRAQLVDAQRDGQILRFRVRLAVDGTAQPGLLYGAVALGASGYSTPLDIIGRLVE
jgi:hypothetical protein